MRGRCRVVVVALARAVSVRATTALALTALAATAFAGCAARPGAVGPRFELSTDPTPVIAPVDIRLLALPPGERVTITATTRAGGVWSSRALYTVPPDGTLDLSRDAPLEAPFTGADGMGLFWTLRSGVTAGSADSSSTSSTSAIETWAGASRTVTLRASVAGRPVASVAVHRIGLSALAPSRAVFDAGLTGDYFAPVTSSEGLRPGVLVLDGTDPGAPTGVLTAATFAALGYPALNLSTFGSSGAGVSAGPRSAHPYSAHTLPAERLVVAARWLQAQPGVDDARIFVFGSSRGGALALWVATAYPSLIYGAIAPAGTTGLVCPSPVPQPAVTVGGAWVPCVSGTREVTAASVLDLRRIPGPVVLGCAGRDAFLDSGCAWLAAAAALRPERDGDDYLVAPGAGHFFFVPPYSPLLVSVDATAQATERARVVLWQAIAGALGAPSAVPGH